MSCVVHAVHRALCVQQSQLTYPLMDMLDLCWRAVHKFVCALCFLCSGHMPSSEHFGTQQYHTYCNSE